MKEKLIDGSQFSGQQIVQSVENTVFRLHGTLPFVHPEISLKRTVQADKFTSGKELTPERLDTNCEKPSPRRIFIDHEVTEYTKMHGEP